MVLAGQHLQAVDARKRRQRRPRGRAERGGSAAADPAVHDVPRARRRDAACVHSRKPAWVARNESATSSFPRARSNRSRRSAARPARRSRPRVPASRAEPQRGCRSRPLAAASGYRDRAAACRAPSRAHRPARSRKMASRREGPLSSIGLNKADSRRATGGNSRSRRSMRLCRTSHATSRPRPRHGGRDGRRLSAGRGAAIKDAIAGVRRRRAATRVATPRPERRTNPVHRRRGRALRGCPASTMSASGAKRPGAT